MKLKLAVMLAVLIFIGAASVLASHTLTEPAGKAVLGAIKDDGAGNAAGDDPKAAATVPVKVVPSNAVIRLTGTLTADERSDVAVNTSGIVQKVFIERGSMVEKGDVLIKIDPADAQNMLNEGLAAVDELRAALGWQDESKPFEVDGQPGVISAKAALDLAETSFARYQGLFAQNAISKAAFDQASTEREAAQQRHQLAINQAQQLYQSYKRAKTRVAMLEKAVKDTEITAPISGLVAERYTNPGERVSSSPGSSAKVAQLVKIDPLRLVLTIPQQNAAGVTPGQDVSFQVDTFPGRNFSGKVKYIGPNVEANSRSLLVEAIVPNPDRELRPGFFATAELATGNRQYRIVIPPAAIVKNGDSAHVFVIRDGVARESLITLGAANADSVEVLSGLQANDVVVTEPAKVRDGDRVS